MACDLGVYGMAVMGANLALNVASRGFSVCVCNRSPDKVDVCVRRSKEENVAGLIGVKSIKEFVGALKVPRKIVLLVQAGAPVDALLLQLLPLLSSGDLVVDGGNEYFKNSERRMEECAAKGILYMGMGVSGGEEGARFGPSLMPGGSAAAYAMMEDILVSIAAKIDESKSPKVFPNRPYTQEEKLNACVTHIGLGGAGNYVKMVHNGIEYGDMELIAEAYTQLKHCHGMGNSQIRDLFMKWNTETPLQSYLIEITATILSKKDGDGYLVDKISDVAGSKGTGMWTVQEAATLQVPVPTIAAGLEMRYTSANLALRKRLESLYSKRIHERVSTATGVNPQLIPTQEDTYQALYLSKLTSYTQGMQLLSVASEVNNWNLNLAEICRIWKGGCILRAKCLDLMRAAFIAEPKLPSLLLDKTIHEIVVECMPGLRKVLSFPLHTPIHQNGASHTQSLLLPLTAMSASYQYLAAVVSVHLPTSIIQAQRDLFGAHTFARNDKPGVFHEEHWDSDEKK